LTKPTILADTDVSQIWLSFAHKRLTTTRLLHMAYFSGFYLKMVLAIYIL